MYICNIPQAITNNNIILILLLLKIFLIFMIFHWGNEIFCQPDDILGDIQIFPY